MLGEDDGGGLSTTISTSPRLNPGPAGAPSYHICADSSLTESLVTVEVLLQASASFFITAGTDPSVTTTGPSAHLLVLSTKSIRSGLNPSDPNVIGVIVTTLGIDTPETLINDGMIGGSAKVITDGIPDGGSNVITLGTLIGPSGPILIEGNTTGGKLIVTGTGVKSGNVISGKFGIVGNSIKGTF